MADNRSNRYSRTQYGDVKNIQTSRVRPASSKGTHDGAHHLNNSNRPITPVSNLPLYVDDYEAERQRETQEVAKKEGNRVIRILVTVIVSIVYWPLAAIGVISPFLEGFNFGALAPWQVIFARFWLAFVMGGILYALAINLFHVRNWSFFQKMKPLKIALVVVLTIAISFGVIRLVCLL